LAIDGIDRLLDRTMCPHQRS